MKDLNKVMLIGNLTRDPEMRFTTSGQSVATFSIATNRRWKSNSGEMKDEAQFHEAVAWGKLAEITEQFLKRGGRVYIEGRLQNRSWEAQDGTKRNKTEIVVSDIILLDKKGADFSASSETSTGKDMDINKEEKKETKSTKKDKEEKQEEIEEVDLDDIPF